MHRPVIVARYAALLAASQAIAPEAFHIVPAATKTISATPPVVSQYAFRSFHSTWSAASIQQYLLGQGGAATFVTSIGMPRQPPTSSRLFAFVSGLPSDYQTRAEAFGFASPGDVAEAMKQAKVVVLDVRTKDEIDEQGTVDSDNAEFVYSNCTPSECPELESNAESLLPDKDATIVVHCASGKRAAKAREVLERQGYGNVLNAGALSDLKAIMATEDN